MSDTELDAYAFPGRRFAKNGIEIGHGQGMTLRDWFAGQALAGAMNQFGSLSTLAAKEEAAADAYAVADAMLAARSPKDPSND